MGELHGPGGVAMYGRYALASITGQMQYKVSFMLSVIAEFFATGIEVGAIWALFDRFGNLPDWSVAEVCLFYGIVNISFAITDSICTGFDKFGTLYVRTGNFDRLLLRPRSLFLQLIGHELALRRVGRLIQGLVIFSFAFYTLDLPLDPYRVSMVLLTIVSAMAFFLALFVLQATISFWSIESLEIMNTFTYGGVESAQYPIAIYEEWFQKIFTFIIPLACISYFPMVAVLGIEDPLGTTRLFQTLAPLSGIAFLLISVVVFQTIGLKHYTSTGS